MVNRIIAWVIAIGIILLLIAMSLPNFIKAKNKSSEAERMAYLHTLEIQQQREQSQYTPYGGTTLPNGESYDATFYENYGTNPFVATEDERFSTFGMDVDTASYVIGRRYVTDGNLPDPDSVRVEEYINYFHQEYPEPQAGDIFSINIEGAESEFGRPNYHLMRIGIKAASISEFRPSANMIFCVDVSGSMAREDRLEQVKVSLNDLVREMKADDQIGLVVYGTNGQVVCDLTSNHDQILRAVNGLRPSGSTYAEQGLNLAYDMARRNFDPEKINRIILCSDGVANVGFTDPDAILERVRADAVDGISLTTIGFGMGNYNDVLMEKLANHGDGMYYYVDSPEEASRVFSDGASSMLLILANDAKIQVEFNTENVERFRLLGYENRALDTEDFEDDTIDAGEVGSGQTVTALYEVRIKDDSVNDRYDDICTVRVRFKNLMTGEIDTNERTFYVGDMVKEFNQASADFRFLASVAEYAEILKDSYWAEDSSFEDVLRIADSSADNEEQREFCQLVRRAVYLNP
ncbi:MAG TPA: von Willebrand factor type A domain-containing protein [bacterium]|jgi:Ca-activated chloride channel family protein